MSAALRLLSYFGGLVLKNASPFWSYRIKLIEEEDTWLCSRRPIKYIPDL